MSHPFSLYSYVILQLCKAADVTDPNTCTYTQQAHSSNPTNQQDLAVLTITAIIILIRVLMAVLNIILNSDVKSLFNFYYYYFLLSDLNKLSVSVCVSGAK